VLVSGDINGLLDIVSNKEDCGDKKFEDELKKALIVINQVIYMHEYVYI
jgi:hypothetical protein